MFKRILMLMLPVLLAFSAFADHDFLSGTEIDQVREVQEPVGRIKLYLAFAKQRLDQLQSTMAKNRAGRSGEVRQLLEDYTSILDAINEVSDDALHRKNDVTTAPALIADSEKKFLDLLEKVQASSPADLDAYNFELKEAISTTGESVDLAKEDLGVRAKDIDAQITKENKEVTAVNSAEKKQGTPDPALDAATASAQDSSRPARPAPTLYRPGEKKPDDDQK
jgi:uncharacterized protein involved in exopolysaccharide biosynthesis